MTTDNFWDTGIHPVTGFYFPSLANKDGNSAQRQLRFSKVKKANSAKCIRKTNIL